MVVRGTRFELIVGASGLAVLVLCGVLLGGVGKPYPGFFFSPDYRIFPLDQGRREPGVVFGDRIVAVDGQSPTTLMARLRSGAPVVRLDLERDGTGQTVEIRPQPLRWRTALATFGGYYLVSALMLAVGVLVIRQNPVATPNRRFLVYMCLWAVANVAIPDATMGLNKSTAALLGLLAPVLSVHGWVLFLTYPSNPPREAWLKGYRVIPRLYAAAIALGIIGMIAFGVVDWLTPDRLVNGWFYPFALIAVLSLATVSFPIKVWALFDTRLTVASPLVNQQATVLLLGIAFGLGGWLLFMLAPLSHLYQGPVDAQVGSALGLLYPAAIAYATVRYRLFDASLVIRRSLVYTALAGLVTGAYALAIAGANLMLARADLSGSPWFSAAFVFVLVLVFNPLRDWLRRVIDRTFFRQRSDYARAIRELARSLTGLLDLDEITWRVTTTIESSMHAREARLWPGEPSECLRALVDVAPGALSRYQLAADPRFRSVSADGLGELAAAGAEVVVPLRFQGEIRGTLLLGPKRSESPYTADDLALLETLADQAAVAVANATAHRRTLEYAQQLERSLLIRSNLAKFVPQRVRELIEQSPEAPLLDKRETEVTVLFADISGYTRLSARIAPDTLVRLVEQYFGAFLDEIVKRGGDVNETSGDGLMVIFHVGDHAAAAVDAARAIHARALDLNGELADWFDPLAMHTGINTGGALLGATKIEGRAGARWTYTASGMTTNIAARLASVAQGGEIVISAATCERLGDGVDCEDRGFHTFKNVDGAIRVYRVR